MTIHEKSNKKKLQMHENLHKNVITFLYKFSWFLSRAIEAASILQLYTAYFLYPWFLINLKLQSNYFRLH